MDEKRLLLLTSCHRFARDWDNLRSEEFAPVFSCFSELSVVTRCISWNSVLTWAVRRSHLDLVLYGFFREWQVRRVAIAVRWDFLVSSFYPISYHGPVSLSLSHYFPPFSCIEAWVVEMLSECIWARTCRILRFLLQYIRFILVWACCRSFNTVSLQSASTSALHLEQLTQSLHVSYHQVASSFRKVRLNLSVLFSFFESILWSIHMNVVDDALCRRSRRWDFFSLNWIQQSIMTKFLLSFCSPNYSKTSLLRLSPKCVRFRVVWRSKNYSLFFGNQNWFLWHFFSCKMIVVLVWMIDCSIVYAGFFSGWYFISCRTNSFFKDPGISWYRNHGSCSNRFGTLQPEEWTWKKRKTSDFFPLFPFRVSLFYFDFGMEFFNIFTLGSYSSNSWLNRR